MSDIENYAPAAKEFLTPIVQAWENQQARGKRKKQTGKYRILPNPEMVLPEVEALRASLRAVELLPDSPTKDEAMDLINERFIALSNAARQ